MKTEKVIVESELPWFRNFYECPDCEYRWTDEWTATCDDDCPACGSRHITPFVSEDIEGPGA